MMALFNIQQSHKDDLKLLHNQPNEVISEFCKLATIYFSKGSNIKIYQAASQKLGASVSEVQSAVEGLVFLFLEASRIEVNEELFREFAIGLDFKEESIETLYREYQSYSSTLSKALPQAFIIYPHFSNLEWRFETQVSSKSIRNEFVARILMKWNFEKGSGTKSICIQSDIPNIIHMSQILNQALEESRTNHSRRVHRAVT